jgi:nitric oxide reductase subunit B
MERMTALRVVYLAVILIFGGGLIGTGYHWCFTGQTDLNLAPPRLSQRLRLSH